MKYVWVEGHAKEKRGISNCSLPEVVNDMADELAKLAIKSAVETGQFIDSNFPFERVKLVISGEKTSGKASQEVERHWGRKHAQHFFNKERIVDSENFDLIWWDGVEGAMHEFAKMYRVWITKHVSEFCGTRIQLSYWNENVSPKCPCCGEADEYTMHIRRF